MQKDLKQVLGQLTLEEKASLCSGHDFWHLKGIERLEIPSIMVTDGPHGLRKQAGSSDHIGINESVKATCFPTAAATASAWDPDMLYEMGQALGDECLQEEVSVLLGPGVNIKRSPLCGRNFEYISEDPYLAGKLGAALVNGVQSKGVGTSLKHYVANNQEYRRMATDSVVDERALRELYLAAFEGVVREADPWTVMCSYNKINGTYASDHHKLLTQILKEEWGHSGIVVTDWGATNDRVEGIRAGLELEMPASGGQNDMKIVEAVKKGALTEEQLDKAVLRILELIFKSEENRQSGYIYDKEAHHMLARKIAGQSIVLLKNEADVLPLNSPDLAIIGEFARTPRYQGAGSSLIAPTKVESALDELDRRGVAYRFKPGYRTDTDQVEFGMTEEAKHAARGRTAVVFAGLTDDYESEGFDRSHMEMPGNHDALIEAIAEVADKVIVVLQNGAPVAMPWLEKVDAVVEAYLGGQAGGPAIIDVLFGDVNPSGRLAETFPISLSDDLATRWFGMGPKTVEYRESIYVGYRYFDSAGVAVQFPFGYGLSYTAFEYSDLSVSHERMSDSDQLVVTFKVTNAGGVAGADVAQLYVTDVESTIYRPEKELKAFKKVWLEAGETQEIVMTLDKRAFAYYNVNIKDWHVESGDFKLLVGASSRDIRLVAQVAVESSSPEVPVPDYRKTAPVYYDMEQLKNGIPASDFEVVLGRNLPDNSPIKKGEFDLNSTMEDISVTMLGKMLYKIVLGAMTKAIKGADEKQVRMMKAMVNDMPLRSMVLFNSAQFSFEMASGLVDIMNGKAFGGIKRLLNSKK